MYPNPFYNNHVNYRMFIVIFFLPTLQAILFCLAIGHDPKSLYIGVVNEELDPNMNGVCTNYTNNCSRELLSCRYLHFLSDVIHQVLLFFPSSSIYCIALIITILVQVPFQTIPEALNATKDAKVWGLVHFGANFSENLISRHANGSYIDMDTIVGSRINIMMDSTSERHTLLFTYNQICFWMICLFQ